MTDGSRQESDEDLMHRYRLGEVAAFDELYRRFAPRIYGYLKNRIRPQLAGEVFQETFLRLHRYRARYDRSYQFAPWIFSICRSAMIDTLRKQGRIEGREFSGDVEQAETAGTVRGESGMSISSAVAELPERDASAIALRYGSDLRFEKCLSDLNRIEAMADEKIISPPPLQAELQLFLAAEPVEPPPAAVLAIRSEVSKELHPSPWLVLVRLFILVCSSGALTLLVCPHFGLGYGSMFGMMDLVMRYGDHFCQALCGSIFIGVGTILAAIVLRPEELVVIRRHRVLQLTVVSAGVLGLFVCAGAAAISTLGLFWMIGALFGGLLTFEIGFRLRFFVLDLS